MVLREKTCVKFSVELGSEEHSERDDVEPEEKGDAGAEGAIDLGVVRETRDVPAKGDSGGKPHHGRENGPREHTLPGLPHGRSQVIDKSDDTDAAGKDDCPANEQSDGIDGRASRGHNMESQPLGHDLTEDNESAGQSERNQRERDQEKSAKAALPEGPAVAWEIVGAADAFHQRGEDTGRSGEADDERDDEGVSRTGAVRRVDEVALQQRTDVGGKDAVKESGQLEAEWSVVGKETDNSGGDDEGGKEGHHRGVGGGLGEVETVMPCCAKKSAMENARKTQESSHKIVPRV